MKKKLSLIILAALMSFILAACGETTMDGGNDTNGMAGEPGATAPKATGSTAEKAGDVVKDATEGVGNAGKAMIDGAENAVNDITNGVTGAVDNATGR